MSSAGNSQGRGSDGNLASWTAVIVVVAFAIASVAWLGYSRSADELGASGENTAEGSLAEPAPPTNDNPVLVPAAAPWAPGTLIQSTDHYPQAGEQFSAQSCTVAFSFTSDDGRAFAVTAGHCGKEGDLVWPTTAAYASDYAVEAGHFIYSGMFSQTAASEDGGTDIGIIEITDPSREMELVGQPIMTGLYAESDPSLEVCKTGGTTGYTCGSFEQANRSQMVIAESGEEVRTRGNTAQVCAAKGDSGGPVFNEVNGRSVIIGVVSGTEVGPVVEDCSTEQGQTMLMSYSTTEQALQVINEVVPNVSWLEESW